jgi:hypothetical protein
MNSVLHKPEGVTEDNIFKVDSLSNHRMNTNISHSSPKHRQLTLLKNGFSSYTKLN